MNYSIVKLPSMKFVGITGSHLNFSKIWTLFYENMHRIKHMNETDMLYGIELFPQDYHVNGIYTYMACTEVIQIDETPSKMEAFEIPEAFYLQVSTSLEDVLAGKHLKKCYFLTKEIGLTIAAPYNLKQFKHGFKVTKGNTVDICIPVLK
ncbi:hypothetical protein Q75_07115 [Bacillus coahuilensis p1.1.43]|uniref:GyrI-like small molecule binding domain-containing protein n=1 Tax=Bacillus coahuilensis p1.1.43 TaxID=1150625 RepID=A0A147K9A2_9BACI|nr:effector binding domain-containing protein [Bacillus coahuilensis]KUP06847.1 hypothetical protein Q75_07115 [Bacillus coahuilensis p1.1.43]